MAAQAVSEKRVEWGTRLSFILAACGGAIGMGNLLRYPSVAWANYGLQWFIPYFGALFFIGLPLLCLEIAIGQTYRSGNFVGLGRINKRLRGLGAGTAVNAFAVSTYFQIILGWVFIYLGYSFTPGELPWTKDPTNFLNNEVIRNVPIEEGNWHIVWPTLFATFAGWILVYLCLFKGVNLVGKIVYFTMGFPVAILVVLLVRGVTLENAGKGISFYVGGFYPEKLFDSRIWLAAAGQIFLSLGAGFGTFTAYASHNPKDQDVIVDTLVIGLSNSAFEVIAAFGAFGVAGYLGLDPAIDKLDSFSLGFLTYPTTLANLPWGHIWCILFFFNLFVLGIDSAFSLVEPILGLIMDSETFQNYSRENVTAVLCIFGALTGFIYSSDIGYAFLLEVDRNTNELALPIATFSECFALGYIYRYTDVIDQVGVLAFGLSIAGYLGAIFVSIFLSVTTGLGGLYSVIIGILIFATFTAAAMVVGTKPTVQIIDGDIINKYYWLTMYQADQLRKDLNASICTSGAWEIPLIWAYTMKFITGPITALIGAFSIGKFADVGTDVTRILGSLTGAALILFVIVGILMPRFFDIFLPPGEQNAWEEQFEPGPGVPLLATETLPTTHPTEIAAHEGK